jgi:hypothetical protein
VICPTGLGKNSAFFRDDASLFARSTFAKNFAALFCHRHRGALTTDLTPASRRQDHTLDVKPFFSPPKIEENAKEPRFRRCVLKKKKVRLDEVGPNRPWFS